MKRGSACGRRAFHGIVTPAILALAACGGGEPQPVATFDCGDFRFTVAYAADTAIVTVTDDTFRLPRAISASGARYSDGVSTFWEHQGAALLEFADTSFSECPLVSS